jgi:DNA-binding NarL/FixJ family response regulator
LTSEGGEIPFAPCTLKRSSELSPESKKHVRVLLIEDNPNDAERITKALEAADMQLAVERVETVDDLAAALKEFKPDVVLSEHTLPRIGFRQALETMSSLRPQTPLIVVTGPLHTEDSGCCVRAGAETVILKTNLGRLAPAVAQSIAVRSPLASLTSRQLEVMRMVANGFRTREIAEHLNLSEKTIESHRTQVMRRLGTPNTVSLIRYAVRVGLALAGPDIASPASSRRVSAHSPRTRGA